MEYEEILKGMEEKGIYSFIANNYWKLDKEDLRDIAKELNYILDPKDKHKKEVLNSLKEIWNIEEK